jgi:hypothetical protein
MGKDISIQFHALPDELMDLVRSFVREVNCHVTALKFQPFEATLADASRLSEIFHDVAVRRVALTLARPVLSVGGLNEFLDRNSSALLLDIGRRSNEGLRESWLTAKAQDTGLHDKWKEFAERLRSMTKLGTIATNPQTGASVRLKGHRFSSGAKELENEGVPMLPAAGTSRLRFEG